MAGKMKEFLMHTYSTLVNDEELKRMLYYEPNSYNDDPLSPDKENISSLPDHWDIVKFRVKKSLAIADILDDNKELNKEKFARVCMYPNERNTTSNYMSSNQNIVFEVWVHHSFDETDFRMSMITDRLADLFQGKEIEDVGEMRFMGGRHLGILREGKFVGYRVTYGIGDFQW